LFGSTNDPVHRKQQGGHVHLKAAEGMQVQPITVPSAGKGLFYVGAKPVPVGKRIACYDALPAVINTCPQTPNTKRNAVQYD
jgi:hypothetical protein